MVEVGVIKNPVGWQEYKVRTKFIVVLKLEIESIAVTANEYVPGVAVASIWYWDPTIVKKVGAPVAENDMLITELDGVCDIVGIVKLWTNPVISIDWVTYPVLGLKRVAQYKQKLRSL